ncbi:hypothetical protein [Fimbriimonas ginsengisoli]|uniref:Uncharacterized protein n=1 Tax=Fimbriimonas ginsengisoli Gsoil 348 TaxID=661478 RepID=A0A068NVK9_FIMGI|nr:hypothetical protein [Fimbriimonas ginsengisoli]AIE86830.1 hypothetical protein OP10G_3462 [Fimbriimonas ginsengisoli Gsoil 348]
MADRRYDEKELAAILRAAAAAQAEGAEASGEREGFTLAEVERLAAEVGIEGKHVAAAAAKLDSTPVRKGFLFFGAPTTEQLERSFAGELTDLAWEEVVGELRKTFGTAGKTSVVGSSREWAGGSDLFGAHVSATPRNGQTRYRLMIRYEGGVVLAWMLGLILSFFGCIAIGINLKLHGAAPLTVVASLVAWIGMMLTLSNRLAARLHRSRSRKIEPMMSRIGELTTAVDPPASIVAKSRELEEQFTHLEQR